MRSLDARGFGIAIVIVLMVLLVDASWIRLQYWLLGDVLLPAAVFKPLIALVSIAGALTLRRRLPRRPIMIAAMIMLAALVLNFANLVVVQGMPVRDVLISHNAYYWPFILLPLVLLFRNSVPETWFERFLLFVGVPLAALGLLQFVLQQPLLDISLPEASFRVSAWRFYGTGHVRAFSLFGSGQTFGYLLSPLAALLTVSLLRERGWKRFLSFIFLLIVLGAAMATLTRNTYVMMALTLIGTLLYMTDLRRWTWFVPVIYHVAAAIVIAFIAGVGLPRNLPGLLDLTSLTIRFDAWSSVAERFSSSGLAGQLLGLGLTQNNEVHGSFLVLVDNAFFAVLLLHGWIGLIAWMGVMWMLWMLLHRNAVRSRSAGAIALAAVFSAWPIVGLFNVTVAVFAHIALIGILIDSGTQYSGRRPDKMSPRVRPVGTRAGQGAPPVAPIGK